MIAVKCKCVEGFQQVSCVGCVSPAEMWVALLLVAVSVAIETQIHSLCCCSLSQYNEHPAFCAPPCEEPGLQGLCPPLSVEGEGDGGIGPCSG